MNAKIRQLTTCHGMYHTRADIEFLYIKKENGGRGLIQQELTNKTTTKELKKYLDTTKN